MHLNVYCDLIYVFFIYMYVYFIFHGLQIRLDIPLLIVHCKTRAFLKRIWHKLGPIWFHVVFESSGFSKALTVAVNNAKSSPAVILTCTCTASAVMRARVPCLSLYRITWIKSSGTDRWRGLWSLFSPAFSLPLWGIIYMGLWLTLLFSSILFLKLWISVSYTFHQHVPLFLLQNCIFIWPSIMLYYNNQLDQFYMVFFV